nr:hypothetical protein [Desmospora activa]
MRKRRWRLCWKEWLQGQIYQRYAGGTTSLSLNTTGGGKLSWKEDVPATPSQREKQLEEELKETKSLLGEKEMQIEILRKKTDWGRR